MFKKKRRKKEKKKVFSCLFCFFKTLHARHCTSYAVRLAMLANRTSHVEAPAICYPRPSFISPLTSLYAFNDGIKWNCAEKPVAFFFLLLFLDVANRRNGRTTCVVGSVRGTIHVCVIILANKSFLICAELGKVAR